ncbi:MAG: hypothetical protein NZS48_09880 [Gemmata sp.]|nr:hypothetical protein [Gemmata sp.]
MNPLVLQLPLLFAVLLIGLVCSIPLAMYLFWLANLTRRDRPTLLNGPQDFAALVAGLSGYILAGGGLLLTLLQTNFRYWMRGNMEALREVWIQEKMSWILLVVAYLLAVVGTIVVTYLGRRYSLVIYNIEPAVFEGVLREVFDHLGRPLERQGRRWSSGTPLCELDEFDGGRTVTLRWISPDLTLFHEVSRHLRAALAAQPARENPASHWLVTGAVAMTVLAACCGGLFIFGMTQIR